MEIEICLEAQQNLIQLKTELNQMQKEGGLDEALMIQFKAKMKQAELRYCDKLKQVAVDASVKSSGKNKEADKKAIMLAMANADSDD